MQEKVVVTGGAGFIGSHTVVELVRVGLEPVIVDNFCNSERSVLKRIEQIIGRPLRCHEADCTDSSMMRRIFEEEGPFLGVIHFAAHKAVGVSVSDPLPYYRNNIGALVTILETMRSFDISKLVFSSSCTVYGQPDALPVTEQSPVKEAQSPYGTTKQMCEKIIADYARSGASCQAAVLRYFNPVGAHESALIGELPIGAPENLIPYITQTAVGIRQQLTVFGADYATTDGTCVRDFIHVMDLAEAHVSALSWLGRQEREDLAEVFNVGTGRGTSVLEAIRAFESACSVKLNYTMGPRRNGDVAATYADAAKSERVLGWRARREIHEAMRDAFRWQRAITP